MPHHFTKLTVEASIYCNTCGKDTPWRIVGGLRQYCIPCFDRKRTEPEKEPEDVQGTLF